MQAEVLAIGDEIVSGQVLDTNSQWLSQRLEECGIRVLYHSAVGDEEEVLSETFRRAIGRADIVVSTGGLGPTADDITRSALAHALGRQLVFNPQALEHIRAVFARRKRDMPERNRQQAFFPEGSRMIRNPHGTAPGLDVDAPRADRPPCRVLALPGVPDEMKEMWHDSVGAMMRQLSGGQIIRHKKLKCFGRGESQIEAMLPEGFLRQTDPVVGITASQATITLRIAAQGPDDAACQAKMAPVIAAIRQRLGNLIFGEDEEELEHATVKLLLKRRRTLATAEWGTAGLVANWLGALPEAQACYRGGIVGRDAKTLAEALGISAATLPLPSPGMVEFTQHMALAARRRFHADYALAVSEFPPFDPQADEPKPFFLALAGPSHMVIREIPYAGHPAIIRVLCGKNALNLVRLTLLEAQD